MSHDHSHDQQHSGIKNLKIAFFLNVGFTILEIIGGLYVNSIAIISDAIHDLGDSLSLGTSWYLEKKSQKKADKSYSYGYSRFSLLGAAINGLVLLIGSIFVINEAVGRILKPEETDATGMLVFAIIGVSVNGYAAWKLSKGHSINEKVVSWHLIEDVLGWVAVLIAAIILSFKDIPYLDPALSLAITAYILWNVVKRLKETVMIFLQKIPDAINQEEIEQRFLCVRNVHSLHHTHMWSLEGLSHVFSTHVKLEKIHDLPQLHSIKMDLEKIISEYPFKHATVQIELDEESCSLLESDQE